jgi:Fe2+ or Zn2+ uptake regulation protein
MQAIEFKPYLQEHLIKFTPGVENILTTLLSATTPLSVQAISEGSHLHLATIYRILEKLETIGLVSKIAVEQEQYLYELHQKTHHHHFICQNCKKVLDISFNEGTTFKRAAEYVTQTYGVLVNDHEITFSGLCVDCQVGKLA